MSENTETCNMEQVKPWPKISKVTINFDDTKGRGILQYQMEDLSGTGLQSMELPFDSNEENLADRNLEIKLFGEGTESCVINKDFFDFLRGTKIPSDAVKARKFAEMKAADDLLRNLDKEFWQLNTYKDKKFARFDYSDITERDMFGAEELTDMELESANYGIWSHTGLRKLDFAVENILVDRSAENFEQMGCLYWEKIDGTPIPHLFEEDVIYNENTGHYIVYCNTNNMGEKISAYTDSAEPLFNGRFELHFKDGKVRESWGFPVKVCVHDSTQEKLLDNKSIVSIDFGTSSTCAAYRPKGHEQLFRLSGVHKSTEEADINEYENPTNIMVYNWEELWRQWDPVNENCPFIMTKSDNIGADSADYDSGYTVEEAYKDFSDETGHKRMQAILSELKSIPYNLSKKHEIKFTPYNDRSRPVISATDEIDGEDEKTFNPIKFYGYLLGRVINQPRAHKYHAKYQVTYPVKFDEKLREKIRAALTAGLMRSLPLPVREHLNPARFVEMPYEEPVACLGSIIPGQLTLDSSGEAVEFAVFDLGGGTLDTSYGILREARDEEYDEADTTIQVLDTGGDDRLGGERLIHRLAFHIYCQNAEKMKENRISFILPDHVQLPKEMSEKLIRPWGDAVAESNVYTMTEQLARPLFEWSGALDGQLAEIFNSNTDLVVGSDQFRMKLKNQDNNDVEVVLQVDGISDFLEETIREVVTLFKNEMLQTFTNKAQELGKAGIPEFRLQDVNIFLGGNASRQQFVEAIMAKEFPGSNIQRIGDIETEANRNQSERVTCKTAVAIGQLRINNFYVDQSAYKGSKESAPFQYFVGFYDSRSPDFQKVLSRNEHSREWKRANRLDPNTNSTNLFYSTSFDCKKEDLIPLTVELEVDDPKKRMLFIRVNENESDSIEYRLGSPRDTFSPEDEAEGTLRLGAN